MFILDTQRNARQTHQKTTILVYLVVSVCMIALNQLYGLFGHGVHSAAMTWMFVYPLLGGAGVFLLIQKRAPSMQYRGRYRVFCNLYHAGIAALTMAGFLKGILEIAGTTSPYTVAMAAAGWLLLAAGVAYYWRSKTLQH